MKNILNFIDGKLIPPVNGRYLDNYNPSTGKVYSLIPDSDKEDVNNVIDITRIFDRK